MSTTKACLQVVLIRNEEDTSAEKYAARILDALADGSEERQYIGGGDDLRIPVRVFGAAPPREAETLVEAALHTVVVALVGEKLLDDSSVMRWLDDCWQFCGAATLVPPWFMTVLPGGGLHDR